MLFISIKTQMKVYFKSKEFKCAMIIMLFYACGAFVFTISEFWGTDISLIKDANQSIGFSQLNRIWFFFSMIYPFVIVLPCATSYVSDYQNQLIPIYMSRTSRKLYYLSKVLSCFLGTVVVILVPFLLNMILCNIFFPHNCNTWLGEYQTGNYYRQLLGSNTLYITDYPKFQMLRLYLFSPLLYNLYFLFSLSLFSGLLSSLVMCISFIYKKRKLVLFVPLFVLLRGLSTYDTYRFSVALDTGRPYTNFDILSYVVPTLTKGHSPKLFFFELIIIVAAIVVLSIVGIKNDIRDCQ